MSTYHLRGTKKVYYCRSNHRECYVGHDGADPRCVYWAVSIVSEKSNRRMLEQNEILSGTCSSLVSLLSFTFHSFAHSLYTFLISHDAMSEPSNDTQVDEASLLSNTSIAIICVCVAIGIGLIIGTIFLIRRRRERNSHGFVTFDDESKPVKPLPPPETHDLVFSSILAHTPRPPPGISSNNSSRIDANNSISNMRDSMLLQDGYSYSQLYLSNNKGNSQQDREVDDPKLLLSLARQRESWAGYYSRPNTPQPSAGGDRMSSGSSYQVW